MNVKRKPGRLILGGRRYQITDAPIREFDHKEGTTKVKRPVYGVRTEGEESYKDKMLKKIGRRKT